MRKPTYAIACSESQPSSSCARCRAASSAALRRSDGYFAIARSSPASKRCCCSAVNGLSTGPVCVPRAIIAARTCMACAPRCQAGYRERMHRILRLCFGLHAPVDRATYLLYGGFLMGLKYTVDMALVKLATGRTWTPAVYLSPLFSTRQTYGVAGSPPAPTWLWIVLAAWALPFLWIGVSMTMRRAIDAGLSPWTCLLFFVPLANWILIALLCIGPPRPGALRPAELHTLSRLRAALSGIAAGVGIGIVSFALQV